MNKQRRHQRTPNVEPSNQIKIVYCIRNNEINYRLTIKVAYVHHPIHNNNNNCAYTYHRTKQERLQYRRLVSNWIFRVIKRTNKEAKNKLIKEVMESQLITTYR